MGSEKAEHAEALELIGYGLAKFAGPQKGRNEIANRLAKNRSTFFQKLVDIGMAKSKNAISNRQDYYDPFFGTKEGYKSKVNVYKLRKESLDSVIGHLDFNQYTDFIEAIITNETGGTVDKKTLQLIDAAKHALSGSNPLHVSPAIDIVQGEGGAKLPDSPKDEGETLETIRQHTEVQWILKQLGFLLGCKVFIAKNDGTQQYKGEPLNQGCIEKLPNQGMKDSQHRRASLIDVVWVEKDVIKFAFEVECTTSIYSGILRMSDLVYTMPYNTIKGIIITPDSRKEKVVEQLERPTFSSERVKDLMRYYTIEELRGLYDSLTKIVVTPGTVKPDILWDKAHSVEGEEG